MGYSCAFKRNVQILALTTKLHRKAQYQMPVYAPAKENISARSTGRTKLDRNN